jgi:hypothetical protein
MKMIMSTVNQELTKLQRYETVCPYNGITVCTASLSAMAIDAYRQTICCSTDNFDNCPIFLAKVLRNL